MFQTEYNFAGNSLDLALGRLWGVTKLVSDDCYETQNKTGDLIGTAFVVRDMMQIVDAPDEDGLLRYWGEKTCKVTRPAYQANNLISFRLLVWYTIGRNSCCHVS